MGERTEVIDVSARKRKREALDEPDELEVDLNAPEPPSKKALRKAKKLSTAQPNGSEVSDTKKVVNDSEPAALKTRSDCGIWIGNLPFTATKEDLRKFLANNTNIQPEQISRLHLPEGRAANAPTRGTKHQNKGFAYIDFTTLEALQEALQLSEKLLSGRRVLIKDSKNFEGRPEKPNEAGNPQGTPSQKIFVGNLGFDTSVEDLKEHFSRCGPVSHVHAATFEDSGKSKGYAWIEFEAIEAAQAAARGWVDIEGEAKEDVEEDSGTRAGTNTRRKRLWVNKLKGRQLRMEFAEDKATRYKKRFGKDASKAAPVSGLEADQVVEGSGEMKESIHKTSRLPAVERQRKPFRDVNGTSTGSGYDRSTVQKLTGSIVEAQGKKITFD